MRLDREIGAQVTELKRVHPNAKYKGRSFGFGFEFGFEFDFDFDKWKKAFYSKQSTLFAVEDRNIFFRFEITFAKF